MLNMRLGLICGLLWLSCCFFNDAAAFLSYSAGTLVVSAALTGVTPATGLLAHREDAINRRSDRILPATFRASETVSRAAAITSAARAFVATGATAAMVNLEGFRPCEAARSVEESMKMIRDARRQLDPVDELIANAEWDAIRSIIKTSPLADMKNVISELSRLSDEDDSAALLGMLQDVLNHVQYLDCFSYNNVFIGEERQILRTRIDYDTPRMGNNFII